MSQISKTRARSLVSSLRGQRVLIVGDIMLDEFLWGGVSRISPEAPVPVVQVQRESHHLGGAGNVAANVRALGGEPVLVGLIGQDSAGERVRDLLIKTGIESSLIEVDGDRPTTVKTRIVAHHQQIVRADREQAHDITTALEKDLLSRLTPLLSECNALVISDYQKGLVTRGLMRPLLAASRRRRIPVLVDPKVRHLGLYRPATVITPNQGEAEQATGIRIRTTADLERAGAQILKQLGCQAVLMTRGEHGMALFRPKMRTVHLPTVAREVFDVTGAGDTVIATAALSLAGGASLLDAAVLANHAAGVVVAKVGTATVSPDELLTALFNAAPEVNSGAAIKRGAPAPRTPGPETRRPK